MNEFLCVIECCIPGLITVQWAITDAGNMFCHLSYRFFMEKNRKYRPGQFDRFSSIYGIKHQTSPDLVFLQICMEANRCPFSMIIVFPYIIPLFLVVPRLHNCWNRRLTTGNPYTCVQHFQCLSLFVAILSKKSLTSVFTRILPWPYGQFVIRKFRTVYKTRLVQDLRKSKMQ